MPRRALPVAAVIVLTAAGLVAGATPASAAVVSPQSVVPAPVTVQPTTGVVYTLPAGAAIQTSAAATAVGTYLAGILRPSTGYALPVTTTTGTPSTGIALLLSGADPSVGAEGYQLDVTATLVTVRAQTAAGLFYGVQTLRQLFPATVEARTVQSGPWELAGARIIDRPRYAYRGAMLDVSRHFFGVDVVKRYIDEISQYKINTLHLHLSDDQGWRIVVDAWPRLTTVGGSTQVGGGAGGFYTKAQYTDLVAYAASRHITIVPGDRHAGAHQRGPRLVRRAQLRQRRTAALHRHRGRLQLAVRGQGGHLHVRAAGAHRVGRADPRPLPARRWRRGAQHLRRRLPHVHEPGPAVRRHRRQDRHGLAPARAGRPHAGPGRAVLGHDHVRRGPDRRGHQGRQGRHVAGQQDLPRHEVHQRRPRSGSAGPG